MAFVQAVPMRAGTDNAGNVIPTRFIGDIARRVESLLDDKKDDDQKAKEKKSNPYEKRLTLSSFPMPVLSVAPGVPTSDSSLFKTPWVGVGGSRKHQPLLSDERVTDSAETDGTQNLLTQSGDDPRSKRMESAFQAMAAAQSNNDALLSGLDAVTASLQAEELPAQGKQTFAFPPLIDEEPPEPKAKEQQRKSMFAGLLEPQQQKPQASPSHQEYDDSVDDNQQMRRSNSKSHLGPRRSVADMQDRPIWGSSGGRKSLLQQQEVQVKQDQRRESQRRLTMTIEEIQDMSHRLHSTGGQHRRADMGPKTIQEESDTQENKDREAGKGRARSVQQISRASARDDSTGRSRPARAAKKSQAPVSYPDRKDRQKPPPTEVYIPPELGDNDPIWERSKQAKEERDKAIAEERRRLSEIEKTECSGKPKINNRSRAIARNKSLDTWMGRQRRKLEDLHAQLATQKYAECTFRPQLNSRSVRIFQQFRQTPEEFHQRILREHEDREARKYEQQKHFLIHELGETFTPRITAKAASIQRNGCWWEELYADGKAKMMKQSRSDDDLAYYGGMSGSTTARSGFRAQSARSTSSRFATPSPSRVTWESMGSRRHAEEGDQADSPKMIMPSELPPYKQQVYQEAAEVLNGFPVQQVSYLPDMDELLKVADQYAEDASSAKHVSELASLTFGFDARNPMVSGDAMPSKIKDAQMHSALRNSQLRAKTVPSMLPFEGGLVRISLMEAQGLRFIGQNRLSKPTGDPYIRAMLGSTADPSQNCREVFRSEHKMQTSQPVWNATGEFTAGPSEDLLILKLYDWVDSFGMGRVTISIPDLLADQPAAENWFPVEHDNEAPWAEGKVRCRITYPADHLDEAGLSVEAIRCLLPAERTPEAREKRRQLFDQMDTEGLGTVQLTDVDKCLCEILHIDELRGKPQPGRMGIRAAIQRAFQFANSHPTDDAIEKKEFRILLQYLWCDIELTNMLKPDLELDNDRRISLKYFRGLIPKLADWGVSVKSGNERVIFEEIDPNHNGEVLVEDFFNWVIRQKLDNDEE